MSTRHWIFAIAFGLGVYGSAAGSQDSGGEQKQATAADESAAPQQNMTNGYDFSVPVRIVESEEAAQSRESRAEISEKLQIYDLEAQQGMNRATQAMNEATWWMVGISIANTFFVAIGTGLLVWTLRLTRQANAAATRMVETQRAWLTFDNYEAHPMGKGRHLTRGNYEAAYSFTPYWRNTGKYPAKILTVYTTWRWEDGTGTQIFKRPDDLVPGNQGIIGPDQKIRGQQIYFLDGESERLLSQKGIAEVYGLIEYEDGFSSETRHTEFDIKFWISGYKEDEKGRGLIYMTQTAHNGKQHSAS